MSRTETPAIFNLDDVTAALRAQIDNFAPSVAAVDVGSVVDIGDGIARCAGLAGAQAGELIEFTKTGTLGLALNLEPDIIGVVVMGDYESIEQGDTVKSTGR
ncbi:MAG: hypothetical protein KAX36_07710, partial [Thermoflexales bacterium]|nr:hypothetical protein [Thermoflexales bacterium]